MQAHRVVVVSLMLVLGSSVLDPGEGRAATDPTSWDPRGGIVFQDVTVVTMDDDHTVIKEGNVLVRAGKIAAIWTGAQPPAGVRTAGASVIAAGPDYLLFPGLINLHSHPRYNHLHLWPTPSSDAIPAEGKAGTDPYANRYQWGGAKPANAPAEHVRLVTNPTEVLGADWGLGLEGEIVKYAEVAALLGGETAIQGAPANAESDHILIRNVDRERRIDSRVKAITKATDLTGIRNAMRYGQIDAWLVHLAEGVRDADLRAGDTTSSRAEFSYLRRKGLLTDMTVVIHGTALEQADFDAMRAAPTIRDNGSGDGRGAKLVWSPLSNMLLYGHTTNVYRALKADVLVSLGTDWSPSGSRTLLRELKIADIAMRDPLILGKARELVPAFAIAGRPPREQRRAEDMLDRALVDMVTRNPAMTLRWDDRLGSIEQGKVADLLLLRRPSAADQVPRSTVYRELLDATESDMQLVLVRGVPLAGDVDLMRSLKRRDAEIVDSPTGGFSKAVDVTTTRDVPEGDETLAALTEEIEMGLQALGGDGPSDSPRTKTYSYLKAHVDGGTQAGLDDGMFRTYLKKYKVGTTEDGFLNLEAVELEPLFAADDDFMWHLLNRDVIGGTRLIADPSPPFVLYPANFNQAVHRRNPFDGMPADVP